MLRLPPIAVATPLLLVGGLFVGLRIDRWGPPAELAEAPARLASLPQVVGPWRGTDQELNSREAEQAELAGHLLRRYVHADSGEALTVLAACGRPGPVAAHSPEVCYTGSGFTRVGFRLRRQVRAEGRSAPAEFWVERYRKAGATIPEYLQVYYAWNTSGRWVAADNPRLYFAWAPALYKLYVIRLLPRNAEFVESDPIPGFLRLFLGQLDRCLFKGLDRP
jgi:hypothetical protein